MAGFLRHVEQRKVNVAKTICVQCVSCGHNKSNGIKLHYSLSLLGGKSVRKAGSGFHGARLVALVGSSG